MSDLHIIMSSGKTVHFNILDEGWLGANIGETILHIEDPIPDYTGKKRVVSMVKNSRTR